MDLSIHNFYEKLVINRIAEVIGKDKRDEDYLADIACVALNNLPARYIRHEVDMIFYMPPEDYDQVNEKVEQVVDEAIKFVESHKQRNNPA